MRVPPSYHTHTYGGQSKISILNFYLETGSLVSYYTFQVRCLRASGILLSPTPHLTAGC